MKNLKYIAGFALAGLLSVAVITGADAQRGFHGGGGGFRSGSSAGVGSAAGFRSSVGVSAGFAVRSGARTGFAASSAYHYRPGFGYYGYPSVGFRFGLLPFGYYPFYFGADLYYFYGGAFYRPYDGGGYEVTVPPLGAVVPALPKGAQSIVINGVQYYEFSGVYYTETVDDQGKKTCVVAGRDGVLNTEAGVEDGNTQVAPQVGDIVSQLPPNCRKITLNGKKYFVSAEEIYYEEFKDSHNNVGYRIASIPTAEPKEQEN